MFSWLLEWSATQEMAEEVRWHCRVSYTVEQTTCDGYRS